MRFTTIYISNFKSIKEIRLEGIESALILVGKNNTGKTSILDGVRAVTGAYQIGEGDFNEKRQNIEIYVMMEITAEDLERLHRKGIVSQYKRYEVWEQDFCKKLPSYRLEQHTLTFTFTANHGGKVRYGDGYKKDNPYIREVLPVIHLINADRELDKLQDDLLLSQEDPWLNQLRAGFCMFNPAKECNHCFQCIGLVNQKTPEELNIFETARLLEYKLYQLNLNDLSSRVNDNFYKNGGYEEFRYILNCDIDQIFQVEVSAYNRSRNSVNSVDQLSKGMKSIYMLSLLETYVEDVNRTPSIILVEYPEMFLHPQLQKISSEILYRLSKKNQVIFNTHSPNLLFNFTRKQIRQVVLDESRYPMVLENTDIDRILDDLGYGANDLMNVNFVFIVEGKQDKSRLPLLLEKYYSEVYDDQGNLSRISIITTNSCTNIKTYANLKYINKVYLKDQFLMIRDGDGKDPMELKRQLCRYYDERNEEDVDKLPKVRERNVLVLKYYSFENYFLNPAVMTELGVVNSEEDFYGILWDRWKDYLHKLKSGERLKEVLGGDFKSLEDLKDHMEEFKIHMRGHNIYDIFYGRYRNQEGELLRQYIDLAPREDFADILDAIDRFVYFDSRKKNEA